MIGFLMMSFGISVILLGIGLIISNIRTRFKCESCGKWGGLKVIDREEIGSEYTTKTIQERERYRVGNGQWRDVTVERTVPIIRTTYHIISVCKYCGASKEYNVFQDSR